MSHTNENSKTKVVDTRYAKTDSYKQVLNDIEQKGVCPFCPENFKWHPNPILKREGTWQLTTSMQPYEHARHHFLIIGDKHMEQLSEISTQDWQAISTLLNWVVAEYKLPGGGIALRFGDTAYTGATVCHLHVHLIVPEINPETNTAKPVYFPIG